MENFRVQDQDGLGICYANATSTLLQSVLPDHPELSYMQIASIVAEQKVVSGKMTYARENKNPDEPNATAWDLAMNSSSVCKAIEVIKKEQELNGAVLCPKRKSTFEELLANGDKNHRAYKTILESSKYMDLYKKLFENSSPTGEEFKAALNNLIYKKKKELIEKDCRRINGDGMEALIKAIFPKVLESSDCFSKTPMPKTSDCQLLSTLAPDAKKIQYKIVAKNVGREVLATFKELIEAPGKEHTLLQMKNDFKEALLTNAKISGYINTRIANQFASVMANALPDDKLNEIIDEFNETKKGKTSKKCIDRQLKNYLASSSYENDWKANPILCENHALMNQAATLSVEYEKSGLKNINAVINFVLNEASLPYHEALLNLYAEDCRPEDKVKIPSNLKCNVQKVMRLEKKKIDQTILSNLFNNKAVNVNICAAVYERPDNFSITNLKTCNPHAVVIKGIKCEKGQYKYLVQNSWGKDHVAKNSALEVEKGTGAHWFSEESFYDAAYAISELKLEDQK